MRPPELFLDNAWTIGVDLRRDNLLTGERGEAVTGVGVTGYIAATPTGAAIGSLTETLNESAPGSGVFAATLNGAVIRENLADYVGQSVYEIIEAGTIFRGVTRLIVRDVRTI